MRSESGGSVNGGRCLADKEIAEAEQPSEHRKANPHDDERQQIGAEAL